MTFQEAVWELYHIPLAENNQGHLNTLDLINSLEAYVDIENFLQDVKIIHVAGTNGKGSVCRMLSCIYETAGYKTGLFTSPHIDTICERIQVGNLNISDNDFLDRYKKIQKLHKDGFTFFEWIFVMALLHFAIEKCDVLIIETGLGGRLDATNVLEHVDLSVITAVGLDHEELLGHTIGDIAKEKAGIIKEKGKVVYLNKMEEVIQAVEDQSNRMKAQTLPVWPISMKKKAHTYKTIDFSLGNKYYYYENLRINTGIDYQIENSAIALTCIHAMKEILPVEEHQIRTGLDQFSWVGRFEFINDWLVVDGAHNAQATEALISGLFQLEPRSWNVLLAVKSGKDVEDILKAYVTSDLFQYFFITELESVPSVSISEIKEYLNKHGKDVFVARDLKELLENYPNKYEEPLVVSGSLYLVHDIRKRLKEIANDSI